MRNLIINASLCGIVNQSASSSSKVMLSLANVFLLYFSSVTDALAKKNCSRECHYIDFCSFRDNSNYPLR